MSDRLESILSRLPGHKPTSPGQYLAHCPAHDDRSASLSISTGGDGRVLLHCHAGCSPLSVCRAIGSRMSDLMPPKSDGGARGVIVATYDYTDAAGTLLFQVVRFSPKDFKQRKPIGNGEWAWNLAGVTRVLYRLPEIIAADTINSVLIVEGEKDVDNLRKLGFIATTSSGGAEKWHLTDSTPLHGRNVVIIYDNDKPNKKGKRPGLEHAHKAASDLLLHCLSVRVMPSPGSGKDCSDWIEAGGTSEQLKQLIAKEPSFDASIVINTVSPIEPESEPDKPCIALGGRDPDSGRIVLSPRRTLPTAVAFIKEFYAHADFNTLHSYAGSLWHWRDNRYAEIEDESLRNRLQTWLHDALRYVTNKKTGEIELADFESNPSTVNTAIESIRSYAHLAATTPMPSWLKPSKFDARDVLPCKTVNIHIPTATPIKPTPSLFVSSALDFDYSASAKPAELFHAFLRELWPDDPEQIQTLLEWFGYCLTPDTSQQKILLMVGPKRSGKGTIARVLSKLIGENNRVSPTTTNLAGMFGLQPLVGKSLAIIGDARFSGDGVTTVVERLLSISGEDSITVDRKHTTSVTMKLPTRFMLLTNELPRMNDASGALAGRFVVLCLTKSFYGHEITGLSEKLFAELPGILLLAIEGWKRLRQRGHFMQPKSSADAVRELEDLSSPVGAFVRECCRIGPGYREYISVLYEAWKIQCTANGMTYISPIQTFCRDLKAAHSLLTTQQGSNGRFISGIELLPRQGDTFTNAT